MLKKRIIILGSTGSIGKNCLDVISRNKNRFEVVGLAANSNAKELEKQIRLFKPKIASIADADSWKRLKKTKPRKTKIITGQIGAVEMVKTLKADVVVSAMVGAAGLLPTISALKKGVRLGLANKESMVMAGKLMNSTAKKHGATIIPIDSEHSALWQCLNGEPAKRVKNLILTASGGPFRGKTLGELKKVTLAEALKHPKWSMGAKITIDSSTLMNKGLEVIEAFWLFNIPLEQIKVVVHPQSIVHSMVEFVDSSVMAQLGLPDMRVPIAYALSFPDRWPAPLKGLDLAAVGKLEFMKPDAKAFPCLSLAYRALEKGGTVPATLNAANEVAVDAFLNGKIRYLDIARINAKTMERSKVTPANSLKRILEADAAAREVARSIL